MQWRRGEYEASDDPARIDVAEVHRFLSQETYWAKGVPRAVMDRALRHSLCVGVYRGGRQVAFARVVTDRATFAYLCDVYVLPEERGRGLGKWLVECVLAHPDLAGLRRFCLMTRDAQELYRRYGFRPLPDPARYMEIHSPDVYARAEAAR